MSGIDYAVELCLNQPPGTPCICRLPAGHELPHKCLGPTAFADLDHCLGEWHYDADGKFTVDQYPVGGRTEDEAIAIMTERGAWPPAVFPLSVRRGGIRYDTPSVIVDTDPTNKEN